MMSHHVHSMPNPTTKRPLTIVPGERRLILLRISATKEKSRAADEPTEAAKLASTPTRVGSRSAIRWPCPEFRKAMTSEEGGDDRLSPRRPGAPRIEDEGHHQPADDGPDAGAELLRLMVAGTFR
jgi:hypothetical protein